MRMLPEHCEPPASGFDRDSAISVLVDPNSNARLAFIATISEDQFARAQAEIGDLSVYADYEEWRETREGFEMGLAMAGVDAKIVLVDLALFLAWSRAGGISPSEQALNAFASAISTLKRSSAPMASAASRAEPFAADSPSAAASPTYGDYEQWLRRRLELRAEAVDASSAIEELPTFLDEFVEWSKCVRQICEPSIDQLNESTSRYLARDSGK